MVRYKLKPERAAENVELVHAVCDELHGAQAAEGFDTRASRSRTVSAPCTSSRPGMETTPSAASQPSGASRGHPRTLRGCPGRERAARNRLLPAHRRLRQGSAPRPAARREARLMQAGEAGTACDLVGKRWALQVVREQALGHGGSPSCTAAASISTNVRAARSRDLQQRLRQPMSATPRTSEPCSQASERGSHQARRASSRRQATRAHRPFTRRPSPRRCGTLPAPRGRGHALMLGGALANTAQTELGRATPSCRTS
jgi:hypothetical protein